jgi:hypothetical protein
VVVAAAALKGRAMNWRNGVNAGLLGLVLILAAVVYFAPGEQTAVMEPLLALAPDQVDSLRLERPGATGQVVLQRRGDGWFLIVPKVTPAQPRLIAELLTITGARCPRRYPVAAMDLVRLQLAPPLLQVSVNGQALAFGGSEPLEQLRYIRRDDQVYLCLDRHYPVLNATFESFSISR